MFFRRFYLFTPDLGIQNNYLCELIGRPISLLIELHYHKFVGEHRFEQDKED